MIPPDEAMVKRKVKDAKISSCYKCLPQIYVAQVQDQCLQSSLVNLKHTKHPMNTYSEITPVNNDDDTIKKKK